MTKILDPTLGRQQADADPAPRPTSLSGLKLGLVANGKTNIMAVLEQLADRLAARHGTEVVARFRKENSSRPLTLEEAKPVAEASMAVLSAIGD